MPRIAEYRDTEKATAKHRCQSALKPLLQVFSGHSAVATLASYQPTTDTAIMAPTQTAVQAIALQLPPHFTWLDSGSSDGQRECINYLMVDSSTKTYDISWQRRGGRPHFLGQVQPTGSQWCVTYVGRNRLQSGESFIFDTAVQAAEYLYKEWSDVREARNRQAVKELYAA
ncbi:hypothetical protein H6F86_21155 [Phormidium sp. FACHB-592]|uniref:Uncharacterized protein n=1 Tax=Stenomitos frigidus AS-A4 TaxID=2933935 RepID=A0ABV0KET3_9CYAN|nr:hypothetical protein [Phormidium sp. FACHB-592]MBD2076344.1 hypothetical protein [Phormidium sp. FACHB-592]